MLIKNINEKQTGFASSLYLEIFVKPMDVWNNACVWSAHGAQQRKQYDRSFNHFLLILVFIGGIFINLSSVPPILLLYTFSKVPYYYLISTTPSVPALGKWYAYGHILVLRC